MKPVQALLALFACAFLPLHAASLDDLTYTTTNGEVTITDCDTTATGELVIPDTIEGNPVTSIGEEAFAGCFRLTSITIPDGVTSIGKRAFYSCFLLKSVTIGNGVASIGQRSFLICGSLESINVLNSNVNFRDVNGVLFDAEMEILLRYPTGKNDLSYEIPNSVTSVGKNAFEDCTNLTSVTIPNSVTTIGDYAFIDCTSLTSITIPDGVTSIGYDAFFTCTGLTSVTIGNGVTSIRNRAFSGCTSLSRIEVSVENGNYTDINGVLFNEEETALLTHPSNKTVTNYTIPDGVTSIGVGAFYDCTSLTSITIPDSVTSIGSEAFQSCSGLTSITIPDSVTSIGARAFYNCTSLSSITIPDGVTGIGAFLFSGCTNLKSITIPDSVNAIWYRAFANCSNLTAVTFLGDTPKIIIKEAFKKSSPTIYRKADAKGWGDTFAGRPVKLITEKP